MKGKIFTIVLISCFSCFSLFGQPAGNEAKVYSAFDPDVSEWAISWPGQVSQYDLVYKSPPIDPMQGIPLGNGEVGALVWCEGSRIIIAVNKSDLWDDALFDEFHNWRKEEEDYSTTLRHACRIIIDFKFPVFSCLYLTDFSGRLSLSDAALNLHSASPFGEVGFKAFVDHGSGALIYELSSDMNEDVPVDITLENYGSRTFSHWYSQINRDASIGLSGTETVADSSGVYLTRSLTSGTFAVGGRVVDDNGLKTDYKREHSRSAMIRLSGKRQKEACLVFNITSPVAGDPVSDIKDRLSLESKNIEETGRLHGEAWKSLWHRSFMDYGDDYLNNLWYLTMYYLNASQGGKYPGRFNNGLWSWSRDVQNWNFYFHWNQQELCWPLNAAGFHELIDPYLEFRFKSLPHARKDAKELFNSDGAFISDVTERRGYNSRSENTNHTPVAEIALDFWRQYQYTGDKQFLKERALPFIVEAARFFDSLFERGDDGLYHAREGTGYEGWIRMKDCITELVYGRVLFATAIEALKEAGEDLPEAKRWEEILNNLAPLPWVEVNDELIAESDSGYRLSRGFFEGSPVPAKRIFSAGWGIEENKWLMVYNPVDDTTLHGLKLLDGIFPAVPCSPVFPSGLIGLDERGSEEYDYMKVTTLLYGPEGTGWNPVSVVMARLGLTDELEVDLEHFPERWQIYCNGWGHWGSEGEINKDAEWFFRTNMVRDLKSGETLPLRMWPFRHMSMESMSVLATAMNESLLQSYDGVIRVFPAFPSDRTGRFTLHAVGGFIVSSEISNGEVQWISLKSLSGNDCKLKLPWTKAVLHSNLKKKNSKVSGDIVEIGTKEKEVIMILPEGMDVDSWLVRVEKPEANEKVKYHSGGKVQLGLPKMF